MRLIGKTVTGLLAFQTSLAVFGGYLSVSNRWVNLKWGEKSNSYEVICADSGWKFSGKLPSASEPATQNEGTDAIGAYRQVGFEWQDGGLPMSGSIRVYEGKPLVLFSDTCDQARKTSPAPFPDFSALPPRLRVFSYRQETFAPPSFKANECSTPWLLFDGDANAAVISPCVAFHGGQHVWRRP